GWLPALRPVHLHRQQQSDPQEDKVERQKDQQARLRPNALDQEPDEIVGDVAERHEADVVEDELHDALLRTGIAPAPVLAQAAADGSLCCSLGLGLPSHGVRWPQPRGNPYSSNLRLAALTTSAKPLMSPSIFLRNSSPGPPPGLTAIALSFSRTPPSASARRNSVSSLWAIAGGVLTE